MGGWSYDYNVSLSPNLWIMTFNLDLDLDLGLTIRRGRDYLDSFHGLQPLHSSSFSKNIDYFVGKASLLYPDPMVANYKSSTLSNSVDILLVQSI